MISGLAAAAAPAGAAPAVTVTTAAPTGHRPAVVHASTGFRPAEIKPSGTLRAVRRPTVSLRAQARKLQTFAQPQDSHVSPASFTASYAGPGGANPRAATNGTTALAVAGVSSAASTPAERRPAGCSR